MAGSSSQKRRPWFEGPTDSQTRASPKRFWAGMGGALAAIAVVILIVLAIATVPGLLAGHV